MILLRPCLALALSMSFATAALTHAADSAPKPENPAAAVYPPHIVSGTILRALPKTREDRVYQLHISLPAGFDLKSGKKYPVVFVTDGYWDFTTVVAAYGNFYYAKNVPEMIIVGLGYAGENLNYDALRVEDLAPMGAPGSNVGHADKYLAMLETVAIPLLEKEYHADPQHRYLMGCSNGGLFTLYTLFTKPELFQGYVADSPAVGAVFGFERAFAQAGRTTQARVYIAAGENEWPVFRNLVRTFYRRLEKDGVVKGGLKFHQVENVRHAGTKPDTYAQGLLFVTKPIAPEKGVQTDWLPELGDRAPYGVAFFPAKAPAGLSADEKRHLAEHDAWLADLAAKKRVLQAGTGPADSTHGQSGFLLGVDQPAEAEALAKESPAVKAGVLQYEVVPIAE